MTYTILRIIDILLFTCFGFVGMRFIEQISDKPRKSTLLLLAVSLPCSYLKDLGTRLLPLSIVYIACFLLLFLAIKLLYRISNINNLYGTLAVLINASCLRGIIGSAISVITLIPITTVYNDGILLLITNCLSDLLCLVIILFIDKGVSHEQIILSLKPNSGKTFLVGWMLGSAILMVINSLFFERQIDSLPFSLLEFNYSLVMFIGCYAVLLFTFRINKDKEMTDDLSSELLAQDRLQSALVRDALFVAQANISKNVIIDGLDVYSDSFEKNFPYDTWLLYAKKIIHPDDYDDFAEVFSRKYLLDCFDRGTEPDPVVYRRLGSDNEYHWVKVSIRLYSDTKTNDIHIVGYAIDMDKEMREKTELQRMAQTDSMTKLFNRAAAEKAFAEAIAKGSGALFLMDIDDFKDINDCMGHEVGDKVLINAANRLMRFFGEDNIVARMGGDEFAAYLRSFSSDEELAKMAKNLSRYLSLPPDAPDEPQITFSIGVAPVKESADFKDIYSKADSALYEVKYNGKHGYKIYSDN